MHEQHQNLTRIHLQLALAHKGGGRNGVENPPACSCMQERWRQHQWHAVDVVIAGSTTDSYHPHRTIVGGLEEKFNTVDD